MSENVKVAVRVRPFNKREKERQAQLCIQMSGQTTTITNPHSKEEKRFTFDFSYWSHDGFEEQSDGLLVPTGAQYADQQRVFEDLGRGVLANAFNGFNTSLFAYGQTGSGKSYSMVGYSVNKGIVPITCEELFKKMNENSENSSTRYQVKFSMLEIYNEKVRDLLQPPQQQQKGGLRVRENPKSKKFEVVGLKLVDVKSYNEIETQMELGTKHRTVAATKMNNTSSRAHTIVTVLFEQITKDESGVETTKRSEMNLVDLAGSERANSTGATGERLKEGSNINKSLSTLGKVIQALAKGKNSFVPYRESVLTMLLRNALGGNSKTIMIAALSPADINYDETLSTLRYADQAKQIKNKAVVNESPTEKLIRELKEQIEELKSQLGGKPMQPSSSQGAGAADADQALLARMQEFERQMAFQANVDQGGQPEAQQSTEPSMHEKEKQKKATTAHFTNLNEDPALSHIICHFVDQPEMVVGQDEDSAAASEEGGGEGGNYIHLTGFGIRKRHAVITMDGSDVFIEPGSAASNTRVNGTQLTEKVPLKHNDRLLFGTNSIFLFVNPANQDPSAGTPEKVDYEFAQEEIAKASGLLVEGGDAEEKERMSQILELFPMVAEVNAISDEMDKKMKFSVALVNDMMLPNASTSDRSQVMVKAVNTRNENEWLIDRAEFVDRRYRIQEMFGDWAYDQDKDASVYGPPRSDADPFFIEPSSVVVGFAGIFVVPLSLRMDSEDTYEALDYAAQRQGSVCVALEPCQEDGTPLTEEDFLDDPSALMQLNEPYHIKVMIRWAEVTHARFSTALRCVLYFGDLDVIQTPWMYGKTKADFNYEKIVTINKVTPALIEWMENGMAKVIIESKHKDDESTSSITRLTSMADMAMELQAAKDRIKQLEGGGDGDDGGDGGKKNSKKDRKASAKAAKELEKAKSELVEMKKKAEALEKELSTAKKAAKGEGDQEKELKKELKERDKTISKLESEVKKLSKKDSKKDSGKAGANNADVDAAIKERDETIARLQREMEELNKKVSAAPTGETVAVANVAADDLKESIKTVLNQHRNDADARALWTDVATKVGASTDGPLPPANKPSSVCSIM
ncbi:kinesin family member 1C [Salpingoeca rosetta]|uniref:Kinesin-like protein 6 n=1 Tax=Salpingoeca rosetta (strain ATCC 50818 / BSB-021) TaxID=946362 RepID=F2U0Y2_SALR5|nr:kinesin family member 1C [Salpingoeca rosetta]EGD80556.1 kinesin family member 1C [Salpingoeca rosetta]|eukprot:XP_004997117.1 kinesin family member 1C [Salpingoeca rosetta]